MPVPTNSYNNIPNANIDTDSPITQELWTFLRDNVERLYEIVLAEGVAQDSVNIQQGHQHRGKLIDGTAPITGEPQASLVAGGDLFTGWGTVATAPTGEIAFNFDIGDERLWQIVRASAGVLSKTGMSRVVYSSNIIKKIKSSGGQGVFTCSMHMKRVAAAAGVVGGSLRFGLFDGSSFLTDAHVDIDFDDVTQEFQRFFFTTNAIVRPSDLRLRALWQTQPSDWDTISNGDLVGYNGGYMVTRGSALAGWDIVHTDGVGDSFHTDPDNIAYWWDNVITTFEITTIL